MKTKFGKKLLALFLAVVMSLTAFSGVLTAQAATDPDYHDKNIAANVLGWVELQDEQTCAALLDYLDEVLGGLDLEVAVNQNLFGPLWITLNGRLDSVSGLLDIAAQLYDNVGTFQGLTTGDIANINLGEFNDLRNAAVSTDEYACGLDYRANTSAKEILTSVVTVIYRHVANWGENKAVIRQLLLGDFSVKILGMADLDLYSILNDNLFATLFDGALVSGYQDNLLYNVLVRCLTDFTDWFTPEERDHMVNRDAGYELDTMLYQALSENLLKQINVTITYPDGTTSKDRYAAGNLDEHLFYTPDGNVYIFQYDENNDDVDDVNLSFTPDMSLMELAYDCLGVAWKTTLAPTLGQLNNADFGPAPYDYEFIEWAEENTTWSYTDVASNYSEENVTAWAQSAGYDLEQVQTDLTFNREATDSEVHGWRDINSTTLFNKLCRSPLMYYYFAAETGPLNTSIKGTGTPNIDAFFANDYSSYGSIFNALNDFLIAAVADFLPDYDTSELAKINTDDEATVATTLVNNALKVVQYVADATDKNILAPFYDEYGNIALTETNFEEAMVPFLIACLENNIPDLEHVHKDKWDACKDAEGVAVVALEEYLSYILPDRDYSTLITKDPDGYYNVTLESAILPMCRDAIGYVMMQYVPVTDASGNYWNIYEDTAVTNYDGQVAAGTDIFTLLNSVVCYYADDRGVAALLGACDASGNSTVNMNNDLWENFDVIVNKFFPVFGELQYADSSKYGQFNSYDLIWNDIVSGVLDIADTNGHDETGGGGITNFLYRLACIINAPSFSTKASVNTIYDFLKDLLNGIFNARTSDQTYYGQDVIPANTTLHPFHDLVQANVIAGNNAASDTDLGVLGRFVSNVAEAFGCDGYTETVWDGISFLIQSLASLIDGFAPQLQPFDVAKAEGELDRVIVSAYTAGADLGTVMTVSNPASGLNRYIVNVDNQNNILPATQLSRSYVVVKNVVADKGSINIGFNSNPIAPGESADFNITGGVSSIDLGSEQECVVTYTITYDLREENGTVLYSDLKLEIYQYITSEPDWESLTYSSASSSGFTESFTPASGAQEGTYSTMSGELWSSGFIRKDYCGMQLPNTVVVKTSELESLDNTTVFLDNRSSTVKSIDALVASDPNYGGTDYFAVTCDPTTGALTNVHYFDYYLATQDENGVINGGSWVTNDPKTRSELDSLMASNPLVTDYRFHQVCSYSEISTYFSGVSVIPKTDENDLYECIYLSKSSNTADAYKTWIDYPQSESGDVTLSSGINGIILAFEKVSNFGAGQSQRYQFLAWDGETDVQAESASFTVQIVCGNTKDFQMSITVCDDSEAAEIRDTYNEGLGIIADYTPANFADYDDNSGTSEIYNYFKDVLLESLAAEATAVTADNAATLGSDKAYIARTTQTTDFAGDVAYALVSESTMNSSAFAALKAQSYKNDANGVWYQTRYVDSDGTVVYENPIYTNTELTDDTVLNKSTIVIGEETYPTGYDSLGQQLVKVQIDGEDEQPTWHLLNDTAYETEWVDLNSAGNTSGNPALFDTPYLQTTDTPATTASGEQLYTEVSFTYRTADGTTCTSRDEWVVKIAETDYTAIPGAEYRGNYAVANDKLQYAYQLAMDNIAVSDADAVYNSVTAVREGLNNVNFNVITYEAMADAGRAAESLYTVDYYNDYYYDGITTEEPVLLFSCYASEADEALENYNSEHGRAYTWAQITVVRSETTDPKINSQATTFDLLEAARVFDLYLEKVYERGYIGDKLEEEISCAVNGKSCENKDYKDTPYTAVDVNVEAASYTVSGETYTADNNPDGVTYSEESWAAFIDALDAAVTAADQGNSDANTHKTPNFYVPATSGLDDGYNYQVSDLYNIRKALMLAENGLTEAVATGYTVSAYVGALATPDAAEGRYATTGAVVTIQTDNGPIQATTAETGKFTLENVPDGEYEATITYQYGFTRTFTIIVNGGNVDSNTMVGIVGCDWNGDGNINVNDYMIYNSKYFLDSSSDGYDLGIDITRDGIINVNDYMIYYAFYFQSADSMSYTNTVIQ